MIIVPAALFVGGFVIFTSVTATVILFAMPQYYVWQQNRAGEAELARAEQNHQTAIQEARAKEESAKSLANADVIYIPITESARF